MGVFDDGHRLLSEIAELDHCDASKGERRRVVAQGDPRQFAEGIAGGQVRAPPR
jgi:hypothetical protein